MDAAHRRKLVVAALIARSAGLNDRGEILLTERRADQPLPLYWEFPGGKIEPGEAPEAALVREIHEELGVRIRVERVWDVLFHAYPEYDVYMMVYRCELLPGETPRAVEVKDLAWVPIAGLGAVRILPADEALIRRLVAEGL